MKKLMIACAVCLPLLFTSCGISNSATSNSNLHQTQVVLSQANFRVVGTARGECTQNYWFGIGGLSKESLGQSAMSAMYENANLLTPTQGDSGLPNPRAIINVSVSYKSKLILVHNQVKAIATGTIIEFYN